MKSLTELLNTPRMFDLPLTPDNSVAGLMGLINDISNPKAILLEYGTFAGVSTDFFSRYFDKVIAVDIWHFRECQEMDINKVKKAFEMFSEMRIWHNNIDAILNDKYDYAISELIEANIAVDVVYIDAVHDYEYIRRNIDTLLPLLKKGGWLCGHDITFEGVKKAVEETFGTNYKTYSDTSWAVQI
jgi:predicted O-methyltransferase YrrM